jgi:uncharacterized protein
MNKETPLLAHKFVPADAPGERDHPAASRIVGGAPSFITRNAYTSPDEAKFVGLWECDEGSWRVSYTEWECCWILEGRMRLTDSNGVVLEARAGDNLVIEPGFEGIWEVLEPLRKLYVIVT